MTFVAEFLILTFVGEIIAIYTFIPENALNIRVFDCFEQ